MHTSKIVVVALTTAVVASAGTFFGLRVLLGQGAAPRMIEVPSLAGMVVEQARELAEAKDLRLAIFERRPADQALGQVIKQVPLPGSSVSLGTAIYVIVSTGPSAAAPRAPAPKAPVTVAPPAAAPPAAAPPAAPVEQVVVPRVRGRNVKRAKKELQEVGLEVGRVRLLEDEDRAPGVILRQKPKAGEKVPKGSTIELWLNDTE